MRVRMAVSLTALLVAPLGIAHSQSLESVLARYVAARGGKAKIAATHTQRTHAHITIGQANGAIVIDQGRPALMRMDIVIAGNHFARGYDGSKGWQALIADTGGVQIMSPLDTRNIGLEADFDGPLVNLAAEKNSVSLMGRATVDGRNAYKIQVLLNGGGGYVDYYYLDPTTYLPVVWEGTRLVNGQMLTFVTHFRAYKLFGGLQYPVRIETTTNGTPPQTTMIDDVEINPKLDPAEFRAPVIRQRSTP